MKKYRLLLTFSLIIILFLITQSSSAAPVYGEVFSLRQPDGSMVTTKIWGDEFYQVVESLDGYTLVRDADTGIICYAKLSADGNELVSTGASASAPVPADLGLQPHLRINKKSSRAKVDSARARFAAEEKKIRDTRDDPPKPAPSSGGIKGICLIVDFSDEVGTIPPSDVNDFCNKVGYRGYGNNGSVRDYYYDVSDGNLTYTNYVTPTYYRAQNPKTYYDNPDENAGPKARELLLEALDWLDNSGFDFSRYDADGDGYIDGINCFYAGRRESGWAMGLWPHSGGINYSVDGVSAYRYQITDMGSSLRIGTFCHENGHMICWWPDLYDYGYESSGTGRYCLMSSSGGTNPVEPCAYLKDVSGWAAMTVLDVPQVGTVTAGSNAFYKFPHPTAANEYYLISNRQQSGRDASLPDAGLAIWHVDRFGSNDNEQMTAEEHYRVTLVQADGKWDLENDVNGGDETDLFDANSYDACGPGTDPNTNWWDGTASGMDINTISASGNTMMFTSGINSGITFASFSINNGALSADSHTVVLNNSCSGDPLEYIASELQDFSDAVWLPYSNAPEFELVGDNGPKTVFFKVRNDMEESLIISDSIILDVDTTPDFDGVKKLLQGNESITLFWDAAIDEEPPVTYSIFMADAPDSQDFLNPTFQTTELSYRVGGLVNGQAYYFVVRATDSLGNFEENVYELAGIPAAMTELEGIIYEDTVLLRNDSPYGLTGDLTVMPGVTLTIEPGTRILFSGGDSINVSGTMIAVGTLLDPVEFSTSMAPALPGSWGRIYFDDDSEDAVFTDNTRYVSGSIISNAVISGGGNPVDDMNGAIVCDRSEPYLANNKFSNNYYGIGLYFSNAVLTHNDFAFTGITAIVTDSGNPFISENTFSSYSTGIDCRGSSPVVVNNEFMDLSIGVKAVGSSPVVEHNNFQLIDLYALELVNSIYNVKAENNWWGTESIASVNMRIFDRNDNPYLGQVDYDPVAGQAWTQADTSPAIRPFPAIVLSPGGSTSIAVDTYVFDSDNTADEIIWTVVDSGDISAVYNSGTRELTFSAGSGFRGGTEVIITARDPQGGSSRVAVYIAVGTEVREIETSTSWISGGSPYVVTGPLTVPSGVSLSIDSGAEVMFSAGTGIKVDGILEITGSDLNPAVLTANTLKRNPGFWEGIYLEDGSGPHIVDGVEILFASSGLTAVNDCPDLNNCIFAWSGFAGIQLFNTSPSINNCTFSSNGTYAVWLYNSSPLIDFCDVINNQFDGIYCYQSSPEITNCLISNNMRGLFLRTDSSPVLHFNTIKDNIDFNIRMFDNDLNVDATGNIWGTTNLYHIGMTVYDSYNDSSLGEVVYDPVWGPGYDPNLATTMNAGFELDGRSKALPPLKWEASTDYGAGQTSFGVSNKASGYVHSGEYSSYIKADTIGFDGYVVGSLTTSEPVSLNKGTTYKLSAYVRSSVAQQVRLVMFDTGYARSSLLEINPDAFGTGWQKLSMEYTPPIAGSYYLRIDSILPPDTPQMVLYIDDIALDMVLPAFDEQGKVPNGAFELGTHLETIGPYSNILPNGWHGFNTGIGNGPNTPYYTVLDGAGYSFGKAAYLEAASDGEAAACPQLHTDWLAVASENRGKPHALKFKLNTENRPVVRAFIIPNDWGVTRSFVLNAGSSPVKWKEYTINFTPTEDFIMIRFDNVVLPSMRENYSIFIDDVSLELLK